MLPEDCLSIILSFTSPEDALRASLVSSCFRSASNSDLVWERFLPSDYAEIVSNSVTPLMFCSKKELFQCLSDSVLIDGGNKVIKLLPLICTRFSNLSIESPIFNRFSSWRNHQARYVTYYLQKNFPSHGAPIPCIGAGYPWQNQG
ncbi:hypothetical protein J1N35_023459 [Gossypium stocksii]|uniref:F-box domain-containing protein n=1 Tax=Gossypium stocksii TaxID=47602 RepID=A0A9D3VIL1_9ROSI|nr:hypothetical protein J1N35_023459 [Gossypium stocksii]